MEEKKDIAAQWEMWQVDLVHLPDQNDVFSMDTLSTQNARTTTFI